MVTDCDYCGNISLCYEDGHGGKGCSACLRRMRSVRANIRNAYLIASVAEIEAGIVEFGDGSAEGAALLEMLAECHAEGVDNYGKTSG